MGKQSIKWVMSALLATSALASPAWAQNAGDESIASQRQELDDNGVNPATGQRVTYNTELSIGPSGPGGLRLIRGRGHGVGQSSMSFLLSGNPSISVSVSAGLKTIVFNKVGGIFEAADGSGAALVQNSSTQWTLTLEDGTVIVYARVTIQDSYQARGSTVTYPTGETLTFGYASVSWCTNTQDGCPGNTYGYATRLDIVSSSLGYQFHYKYGKNEILLPNQSYGWKRLVKITAVNSTVEPCNASYNSCSYSQNWPSVAYTPIGDVTDAAGNIWRYTDSSTQFAIRRPGSSVDNIVVNNDTSQRTTSIVRDGMTWTYGWSLAGGLLTMTRTDPLSHVMTVVSDTTVGLPTSITDELNRVTNHTYNSKGQRTRTTFPEGNYVQYTYDARGNVTQVKRVAKAGSGLADIITSATYPGTCSNPKSCNNPVTSTDARGNVTDYTYNSNGDPLTVTSPAPSVGGVRPQTRYTYANVTTPGGPVSQPQSVSQCQTLASCTGAADETKATYGWSNQLILTGVTRANGTGTLSAVTTITNDNVGNPRTIDGPLAGTADTATLRFDNMRRVVGTISPDPDGAGPLKQRAVKTTYHPTGGVQSVQRGTVNGITDPDWAAMNVLETQAIGYDGAARPITASIAGSDNVVQALTQQSYDGEGRPECAATRMNPATFGSLPASACTLGTAGSFGPDRIAKTIYDAADQVTQAQVAVGTADAANERTLTYSANGRLATLTDAEVNKTTYIYDGHDRLSQTQMPSATKGSGTSNPADFEQLTYDAASNVINRRLRDAQSITFTYDNLNRVTLKNLPGSEPDVTYAYDNLNRLTSASQTGNALSFGYDALSRLTHEQQGFGRIDWQYDLAGHRTRTTWWDGFFVANDRLVTGELLAVRENGAASGLGVLASYAYDDIGRRTGLTRGNGAVTTYGYDGVSRLATLTEDMTGTTHDQTATFSYNPAMQIGAVTKTNNAYAWTGHGSGSTASVANGLNQIASIAGAATTHDARGNLTLDPASGRTFAYSSENLLTAVGGGTTLHHDPLLRLVEYDTTVSRRFVHDGVEVAAEVDNPAGAIVQRFIRGDGADELIAVYDGGGTANRSWVHSDERGSVVALSDSGGNVTAINRYDEYGKPQSTNVGRFQYTGQMWLPEIGAYYYKARVYSPTLGRFLQTDPIGVEGGVNLYAYVGNDPVNWVDPLGLQGCTPDKNAGILVCGPGRGPGTAPGGGGHSGGGGFIGNEPVPDSARTKFDNEVTVTASAQRKVKTGRGVLMKLSEEEQEVQNENDEKICRLVKTRECWASAAVRRARRAAGQPVPPPNLQTGVKGSWSTKNVATAVGAVVIIGGVICIIVEPCGAIVASAVGLGGTAVLATQ